MHHDRTRGFTLIELLIVVVILGILAAVAIPKFSSTKQRAALAAGLSDVRNLSTAQEGFFVDSARYAGASDLGVTPGQLPFTPSTGNTGLVLTASASGWSAALDVPAGQHCGVFVGSAVRPAGMPVGTGEGSPVCWD